MKISFFHIPSIIHNGGAGRYWNTGEGHSNILQIAVVQLENSPQGKANSPVWVAQRRIYLLWFNEAMMLKHKLTRCGSEQRGFCDVASKTRSDLKTWILSKYFWDPPESPSGSWFKLSSNSMKVKLIKPGRLMFPLYNRVPLHIFLGCCAESCELTLQNWYESSGLISWSSVQQIQKLNCFWISASWWSNLLHLHSAALKQKQVGNDQSFSTFISW